MITETREQVVARWTGARALNWLYPKGAPIGGQWMTRLPQWCVGLTCEVGSGDGRIAQLFPPQTYTGVDINPEAVKVARLHYPSHTFNAIGYDDPYPVADTYLFFTVLLHVLDTDLDGVLQRVLSVPACKRIVVAECMSRKYRRKDYQRDVEEYAHAIERVAKVCSRTTTLASWDRLDVANSPPIDVLAMDVAPIAAPGTP